jgi:hypothetical protein
MVKLEVKKHERIIQNIQTIPSNLLGIAFKNSNKNLKYHSGEMCVGVDSGSAGM